MNKTTNPSYQTLSKVRNMLDFVLEAPTRGNTCGIGVGHPGIAKLRAWASKCPDPMDGEPRPKVPQTKEHLIGKGMEVDAFTEALLKGANPEDGGGVGTPIWTEGNGDCLFNSVAAHLVVTKGRGNRHAVRGISAKLRLSVVLVGIKYMEMFISTQPDFYGAWYNYVSEVRERLTAAGWDVFPDTEDGFRVGSFDCARLMYLAQLRHIAKQGVYIQQFVFPLLATVLQSPLRVFVPFNTINDAVGGPWKHTLFQPAFTAKSSAPTVHVVMTLGCSENNSPCFKSLGEFQHSYDGRLPELNHYVAVSANGATKAQARARQKFEQAARDSRKVLERLDARLEKTLKEEEPSCGQAQNERKTLVTRLVDDQSNARLNLERREATIKLLTGTYLVPLTSEGEAAAAEKNSFASRTVEAEQEAIRKAEAAAAEAKARAEEKAKTDPVGGKGNSEKGLGTNLPGNENGEKGREISGVKAPEKRGKSRTTLTTAKPSGTGSGQRGAPAAKAKKLKDECQEEKKRRREKRVKEEELEEVAECPKAMQEESGRKNALRKLRMRARKLQEKVKNDVSQGRRGVRIGTRLHTGLWNTTQAGYGTVMKINMGVDDKTIVSYDVLMDSAGALATVVADSVEQDVQYARKQHASSIGSDAGRSDKESTPGKGSSSKEEGKSEEDSCPEEERSSKQESHLQDEASSVKCSKSKQGERCKEDGNSKDGNGNPEEDSSPEEQSRPKKESLPGQVGTSKEIGGGEEDGSSKEAKKSSTGSSPEGKSCAEKGTSSKKEISSEKSLSIKTNRPKQGGGRKEDDSSEDGYRSSPGSHSEKDNSSEEDSRPEHDSSSAENSSSEDSSEEEQSRSEKETLSGEEGTSKQGGGGEHHARSKEGYKSSTEDNSEEDSHAEKETSSKQGVGLEKESLSGKSSKFKRGEGGDEEEGSEEEEGSSKEGNRSSTERNSEEGSSSEDSSAEKQSTLKKESLSGQGGASKQGGEAGVDGSSKEGNTSSTEDTSEGDSDSGTGRRSGVGGCSAKGIQLKEEGRSDEESGSEERSNPGDDTSVWSGSSSESETIEDPSTSTERRRRRTKKNRHRSKAKNKGGRRRKAKSDGCAHGETPGIAKIDRAFDPLGTPAETWEGVFDTLIGELSAAGHHTLLKKRRKLTADKTRHSYCEIICSHAGSRREDYTKDRSTTRNRVSKKVGCLFKIVVTWPVKATSPSITSVHLEHNHDPRGEVSRADDIKLPTSVVDERLGEIRRWSVAGLKQCEIFKLLEMDQKGLLLCKVGKKKVYNVLDKLKHEMYADPEDATRFLATIKSEPGMHSDFTLDDQGRLVDVFWSTVEQQEQCARYGSCIQLDTTVFTNRYGCPLLFVVGVDDENRSCILAQGFLRSECTETFEWVLNNYVVASGGRKPKVLLTDADLAMTSAAATCWGGTLHMYCLWHVLKNVVKNCSSSFADTADRTELVRLFTNAAYAATPEVFGEYQDRLECLVADTACERYIQDLITMLVENEKQTKWAFSCRPTVLTLGMVSTQRTEGMFGVAKNKFLEKKLSLCALWENLKRLYKMLYIETARLATPKIAVEVRHQGKHIDKFFAPIKQELECVGASQYCQKEIRAEVSDSQAYDAELVVTGSVDDDGTPRPLSERRLDIIRSARPKLNILHEAPPEIDLDQDSCATGDALDASMWARSSLPAFLELIANVPIELVVAVRYKYLPNKPSHLVVFGPDNFHLCSCLQLLRRGLPCRHYFAVLVNLIGRTYSQTEVAFEHTFNGACVHNRWRRNNELDVPWSVSQVLTSSGHGEGWDGHHDGDDANYWGPSLDHSDGVHPAEPAVRPGQDRKVSDQRRVFANMMSKSKENVGTILRSVSLDEARTIQEKIDEYVSFLLKKPDGGDGPKNPARPPQKGRPKKKDSRGKPLADRGDVRSEKNDSSVTAGNPEGRGGSTRREKRFKDCIGAGSRKRRKRTSSGGD